MRHFTDGLESEVRYYSRHIPCTFTSARGAVIRDDSGREYIDFLSGCGSLNYGHNHPAMKRAAIEYLEGDGVLNTMDLRTTARQAFIAKFHEAILKPRGLDYRLQFSGPTGANAIEAALKLARKVKGRSTVVAFTNAFHGVTLGALAATGNRNAREASRPLLNGVVRLPFEGYGGAGLAELDRFEQAALDPSGGVEPPAAFIVETVQGEGGLNVASPLWLRRLAAVAKRLDALLIVDDIQAGCGRTGDFFSFERADIRPDIICLSKSLSGMGLPMSLVLLRPEIDVWRPGEHNGTFRGNNLAFVTASVALDQWSDPDFVDGIRARASIVETWTRRIVEEHRGTGLTARGLGLLKGVVFSRPEAAEAVARAAFRRGIIIETAGPRDEVLKLLPPLNIDLPLLRKGLAIIGDAVAEVVAPAEPIGLVA